MGSRLGRYELHFRSCTGVSKNSIEPIVSFPPEKKIGATKLGNRAGAYNSPLFAGYVTDGRAL